MEERCDSDLDDDGCSAPSGPPAMTGWTQLGFTGMSDDDARPAAKADGRGIGAAEARHGTNNRDEAEKVYRYRPRCGAAPEWRQSGGCGGGCGGATEVGEGKRGDGSVAGWGL